jgi:hypothetical protein
MGEPGEKDTAVWASQIPSTSTVSCITYNHVNHTCLIIEPEGKGSLKLPTNKPFPDDTYNLAVYHQLHCLVNLPALVLQPNTLANTEQWSLRQSFWAFHGTTMGVPIRPLL